MTISNTIKYASEATNSSIESSLHLRKHYQNNSVEIGFEQKLFELDLWLEALNADTFPYHFVIEEFHRKGKHFVQTELLEKLNTVRSMFAGVHGSSTNIKLLQCFLDATLDKWDGRYEYTTYLAISMLELPNG